MHNIRSVGHVSRLQSPFLLWAPNHQPGKIPNKFTVAVNPKQSMCSLQDPARTKQNSPRAVSPLVGVHGQQFVLCLRGNGNVPQTIKPLTSSLVLHVPQSPWCYSPLFCVELGNTLATTGSLSLLSSI